MSSWGDVVRLVETRGRGRCEYCLMHQALQGATFHVEHIVPSARGGASEADNLAWACPSCNLRKSDRLEALDPDTGTAARLFSPRTDLWTEHFRLEGYQVTGLTPAGRATVSLLDMNQPRRLLIRQAEELFGLFPP